MPQRPFMAQKKPAVLMGERKLEEQKMVHLPRREIKKNYFQKILALKILNYLIKTNSPLNLKLNSAFFDVNFVFFKTEVGAFKIFI